MKLVDLGGMMGMVESRVKNALGATMAYCLVKYKVVLYYFDLRFALFCCDRGHRKFGCSEGPEQRIPKGRACGL